MGYSCTSISISISEQNYVSMYFFLNSGNLGITALSCSILVHLPSITKSHFYHHSNLSLASTPWHRITVTLKVIVSFSLPWWLTKKKKKKRNTLSPNSTWCRDLILPPFPHRIIFITKSYFYHQMWWQI